MGQELNAALSTLHWNVLPASLDVKVKAAVVLATVPVGPLVIVVIGATVSTSHVRVAGEGSTLPTGSMARTLKV